MLAPLAALILHGAAQQVGLPQTLRWGAPGAEVQRALASRCTSLRDRPIVPPFLTNVRGQRQIDCEGFLFFGRRRHAEFVFGDDRLEMVWIMVSAAERQPMLAAMAAAYGAPSHRAGGFTAFAARRTAWRDDPPELLFYSPGQAAEWRAWFDSAARRAGPRRRARHSSEHRRPTGPEMRNVIGGVPMRRLAFALILVAAACARTPAYDPAAEEAAIRHVIADMEAAWNRGDFRGYMAGFKYPDVVFVSRGQFQRDWQGTLDHYVRDYGGAPERRGRLHFWDVRIEMLAPDAAQLVSRYRLEGGDHPQDGINTRLMRKVDGRWVIALNHVSSREVPAPPADPGVGHAAGPPGPASEAR